MDKMLNLTPPDERLDYDKRIALLRERKIAETQIKSKMGVYQDGDDYGSVPAPEDYTFQPVLNEHGTWFGYEGWSQNFYKLMDEHPVYIDPADAFTCRWMYSMIWFPDKARDKRWNPAYPYEHLKPFHKLYGIVPGIGSDAHFGGDYDIGFQLGWGGLLDKIEKYRKENSGKDEFYDAEVLTIKGVQQWMKHAIEEAERMAAIEKHPVLRQNLLDMAQVNRNILYGAPQTMREACQWACWFNMISRTYNRDGAGFQLDTSLRAYYENDLAAGRITRDEAVFYIACLLLNDPHYYQLGGLDGDDNDLLCEFSYLVLEGADKLNSTCNVTVRVHEDIDRDFMRKCVGYLFKHKNAWPRFSGDMALSEGFMRMGYPKEIARKRFAVGCQWMSLPGLEYTLNDCIKINSAKVFEVAYEEMMESGGPYSTARLWDIYDGHMKKAVGRTVEGIRHHLKYMKYSEPELLLNLISHGPVERGLDITDGGALYYNMGIDGTAIATVADSFGALEQRIEKENRISWETLYKHIQSDFRDNAGEAVRLMMSSSNRYGGGETMSDHWAVRISKNFSGHVLSMEADGIKYIPGWFSWSNTIAHGKMVKATPNGRHAYEPINHGANPHPGFRKDGALTAMTNSICDVQPGCGNTTPLQLELDPGMGDDIESIDKIVDYIMTLFKKGGTLLNINIIDAAQILEAHKDPSKFPELVVRVTGFTAYFCALTPEFRQLVVDRILSRA